MVNEFWVLTPPESSKLWRRKTKALEYEDGSQLNDYSEQYGAD